MVEILPTEAEPNDQKSNAKNDHLANFSMGSSIEFWDGSDDGLNYKFYKEEARQKKFGRTPQLRSLDILCPTPYNRTR